MGRGWLLGLIATLLLASQGEAANLSVRLIQELSDDQFWQTERVASLELEPAPSSRGVISRTEPPAPEALREAPTRQF